LAKLTKLLLKEMARVSLGTNQEECMKVNGRMIRGMDLDLKYLQIITIILASM